MGQAKKCFKWIQVFEGFTFGNFKLCEGLKLLLTSNSVSVTSQAQGSVACYVSKQVDFSKLTVVELNTPGSTKSKSDFLVTVFGNINKLKAIVRPQVIGGSSHDTHFGTRLNSITQNWHNWICNFYSTNKNKSQLWICYKWYFQQNLACFAIPSKLQSVIIRFTP